VKDQVAEQVLVAQVALPLEAEAALEVVMELGEPLLQVVCTEAEAEYGMPTFRVMVIFNIFLRAHPEQLD
jgi:hypothetical protein